MFVAGVIWLCVRGGMEGFKFNLVKMFSLVQKLQ